MILAILRVNRRYNTQAKQLADKLLAVVEPYAGMAFDIENHFVESKPASCQLIQPHGSC